MSDTSHILTLCRCVVVVVVVATAAADVCRLCWSPAGAVPALLPSDHCTFLCKTQFVKWILTRKHSRRHTLNPIWRQPRTKEKRQCDDSDHKMRPRHNLMTHSDTLLAELKGTVQLDTGTIFRSDQCLAGSRSRRRGRGTFTGYLDIYTEAGVM